MGQQLAQQESERGDAGRADDGEFEHVHQTVVLPCAEIVACDGLHPLVEPHDDHHEEEGQPVDDTVGPDHQVAAVLFEPLVDEDDDEAGRHVHQKGRHADGQNLLDDPLARPVDSPVEMQQFARIGEQPELPDERDHLRQHRGDRCAADAQPKP